MKKFLPKPYLKTFGVGGHMKNTVIFFEEDEMGERCSGEVYDRFIDYAFEVADFFMLVYTNYGNKGYKKEQKEFRELLKRYLVKRRTDASWAGTLGTYTIPNESSYYVAFYKTAPQAKEFLKRARKLSDWSPFYPQDLAFFKGDRCWFYSVGHEMIAGMIAPTEQDILFLEENGLSKRENLENDADGYYHQYDEIGLSSFL